MTITIVSTAAALLTAISTAAASDTIKLAPGDYSGIYVSGKSIVAPGVTIQPTDDAATRPVLSDLRLATCDGFTFTGLEFNTNSAAFPGLDPALVAATYPFRADDCTRVTFTDLYVHGSMDGDPSNDRNGLGLFGCTTTVVSLCEFVEVQYGIVHDLCDGLIIQSNYVHDISGDAFHGTSTNVTLKWNYVTDLHPLPGLHADVIQFFPNEDTPTAMANTLIRENAFLRGTGFEAEGVFMTPGTYNSTTIDDNFFAGTQYNAIVLVGDPGSTTAVITDNTLVPFADFTTRIWLGNINGLTETGNQATNFIYGVDPAVNFTPSNSNTVTSVTGNTIINAVADGGVELFTAWRLAHSGFDATYALVLAPPSAGGSSGGGDSGGGDSGGGGTGGTTGGAGGGATGTSDFFPPSTSGTGGSSTSEPPASPTLPKTAKPHRKSLLSTISSAVQSFVEMFGALLSGKRSSGR